MKIAVMPGDGIGKEVIPEGLKLLKEIARKFSFSYQTTDYPFGAEYYLEKKITLPDSSLKELAEHLGVLEAVAAQLHKYRIERILWREWLSKNVNTVAELMSPCEDYPWESFEGPPDDWALPDMAFARVS